MLGISIETAALNVNGTTTDVDAILTIIDIVDISIDNVDSQLGVDGRFEPSTLASAANGYVEWEIEFVISGTATATERGAPIALDSYALRGFRCRWE